MRRIWYYRLGPDHEVIPCEDMLPEDLAAIWDYENRKVGSTEIGPYRVSTVFLVIDHGWEQDQPPVLFETMVFGDDTASSEEFEHLEQRYHTWKQAVAGHAAMVESVTKAVEVLQQAEGILHGG